MHPGEFNPTVWYGGGALDMFKKEGKCQSSISIGRYLNKQVARRRAQQREDRRKTRRWEDIQAGIYHIAGTMVINAKNGTEDAEPILVSASRPRA